MSPREVTIVRTDARPAPIRRLRFGALWALWASLACSVTLLSSYDEQIDRAATELQTRMDRFLTVLEEDPGTAAVYNRHREFYRNYLVDLRAVELRAGTHPKNRPSLEQYRLMRESLEALRRTHEESGTLSVDFVRQTRELFNQSWRAIIALEVAKKRGSD